MANFKKSMSMLTTATILASTLAVNVSAAPVSSVPNLTTDGFVGLVNNPAVAGTAQQFYLTAANYDGDVQYQIFYIDAANPNREDPLKWTKLQDWTKPVSAKTPFLYNIPSLQAGNYSFAVRVKRAGYTQDMTAGYNAAGEYDDAYPFNYTFQSKAAVDVSGIKADKSTAAAGEKVSISGLTGGSKYKLYTFNQASAERWVYASEGSSLDWTPKAAGNYVLDVQVLDSASKVIGWKLINVNVADGKNTTASAVGAKAINSTTVYVTFGSDVQNVSKDQFTIDGGLTVTNAAVKQDDSKVVVLTTSAQTGGTKYNVSYQGNKVGDFTGASSVIPTAISITSGTVSQKVGVNTVVTADIGQKVAGVAVTFNAVTTDGSSDTRKDLVGEAFTDANGIATYTYTRYIPGVDNIYAYPTGAPAVRDNVKVYWGTENRLSFTAQPTTTSVDNDTAQTYTFRLLDENGKAVQTDSSSSTGYRAWVTFAENCDADLTNNSTATVGGNLMAGQNNVPGQNKGTDTHNAIEVQTDSDGYGTFTVTGNTTKATPIVYISSGTNVTYPDTNKNYGPKIESDTLQVKASTCTFGSSLSGYKITVDKTSPVTAAASANDGTQIAYTFTVTKADGTVASGVNLMLGFAELMDNSLTTKTDVGVEVEPNISASGTQAAKPTTSDVAQVQGTLTVAAAPYSYAGNDNTNKIYVRQTDANGKAEFDLWSPTVNQVATPVAWINLNNGSSTGSIDTIREDSEPYITAPAISFYQEKVTSAGIGYDDPVVAVTGDTVIGQDVDVKFALKNQGGDDVGYADVNDSVGQVTWTITNTGANVLNTTAEATNGVIKTYGGTSINATTCQVILGVGESKTLLVDYSGNATAKGKLRFQAVNANVQDLSRREAAFRVSATGTTTSQTGTVGKTFSGTPFTVTDRYATQVSTTTTTGKVVGFALAKSGFGATANGGYGTMSGDEGAKKSVARILVQVDGASTYTWIDTHSMVTNPYNDDANHTKFTSNPDLVMFGTDTTFDHGNFTPLSSAISADKQLSDYLSIGDRVQLSGGILYVANVN